MTRDIEESVLHWRAAAEVLPAIVAEIALDGRVLFVNQCFSAYTGHPPEAVAEFSWHKIVHPDDLPSSIERLARGFAREQPFDIRFRLRRADGTYRTFQGWGAPYRSDGGKIDRWIAIALDIEESVETLRLLHDSESRLQQFLETLPIIVWTADAKGWTDWYNPRWYEFTGQTREEAAGWGWQAAHHPEDFLRVMEAWPRSIATGEPFEMEFRMRRYDGEYHWFLTRIVPLRNKDGTIVRWYGTNVDIEQQKRSEQRSARIAQTLQEAFLPTELARNSDFRFDAVYLAAESEALVGGDWYDAVALDGGRVLISCGDVAGHGVDAAVAAGRIRQAIAFAAFEGPDPADVLRRVNRLLILQRSPLATALVAIFDPSAMQLRYALAGHPPPVFAFPGRPPSLARPGGLPLTVADNLRTETHVVNLPGDAVVLFYTDGFVEFERDIASAESRLLNAASHLVGDVRTARPAFAVQRAVLGTAHPRDDAALLVLQCSHIDPHIVEFDESALIKKWRFHSSDALTARNSRRELVHYIAALAEDPERLFSAELILGEILANTVEHAPGLVEITIDWTGDEPVATVLDTGPGLARFDAALPTDFFDEGGRGLFLIGALGNDVRVRRSAGYGTELTVRLPVRRRHIA